MPLLENDGGVLLTNHREKVQTGGSFDVDYSVVGPNEKKIMDGSKERQGDFVFTANEVGEYRFCFNNEMSTFAEKMVDFEIAVRLADVSSFIPTYLVQMLSHSLAPGRKRAARPAPFQTRHVA